jgi:hypothetical protein
MKFIMSSPQQNMSTQEAALSAASGQMFLCFPILQRRQITWANFQLATPCTTKKLSRDHIED